MASFFRSAPRALSRASACQPLAARARAAPFMYRGLATTQEQPRIRLGSVAPDFSAKTTEGEIKSFHEWIGDSWAILFSHPADYTPVCTTELGAFAKLKNEFDARGVKMIGLSANDLGSHEGWIKDINEIANTNLQFPIIADHDRKVAFLYDMINQEDLD
ncbi:thioredoxin-like protein, partial [Aureobasidium melanogenum]